MPWHGNFFSMHHAKGMEGKQIASIRLGRYGQRWGWLTQMRF